MSKDPAAFAAMRAREAEEMAQATTRANHIHAEEEREEEALFNKLCRALAPYENCELDGQAVKVTLMPKRTAFFFIEGKHWLTFAIERTYYSCHCENVCDCETSTSINLKVTQHRKDGPYGAYFPCYTSELGDEDKFAHGIAKMLSDAKWYLR